MRDLRILAYCTAPAARSVREATGVEPLVSPPYTDQSFDPDWIASYDVTYIRLHGHPTRPNAWYGDDGRGVHPPALSRDRILGAHLGSTTVLLANCYGAEHPLTQALYQAGAGAVIAAPGENYAAGSRVIGADKLARELIAGLRGGRSVERALYVARLKLLTTIWRAADRDAFEFRIIPKA